jgi:hypothetical protein
MKERVDTAKRSVVFSAMPGPKSDLTEVISTNEATLSSLDQTKQSQRNEQVRLETESQGVKDKIANMEKECIGKWP